MPARDAILARMRAAQRKPREAQAAEREAVRKHLAARAPGPRPRIAEDALALFRARALALASTVASVGTMEDAPSAVGEYLRANGLPCTAVCWPRLAALDWVHAGLAVEARAAREADLVGITGSFCAIAETGTLMLVSDVQTPASVSLLPETHVAIVDASRIVVDMEEAWRLLREESSALPRAVNFVSGPSRTADIEQTVTLGAHGPYRVHIIVISP